MKIKFLQTLLLGACALGTLGGGGCHAFEVINESGLALEHPHVSVSLPPVDPQGPYSRDREEFKRALGDYATEADRDGMSMLMAHQADARTDRLEPEARWQGEFIAWVKTAIAAWSRPDAPEICKSRRLWISVDGSLTRQLGEGRTQTSTASKTELSLTHDDPITRALSDPNYLELFVARLLPPGQPAQPPRFEDGSWDEEGHLKAV